MALAALHGQPHPYIGSGLDPVDDILNTQFLCKGTSLIGGGMVAVKARGHPLVNRGIGQ